MVAIPALGLQVSTTFREVHEPIFANLRLTDTITSLAVSQSLREGARARLKVLLPLVRPLLAWPFELSLTDVLRARRCNLNAKKIGDTGCTAFAEACAMGALAQCCELYLSRNQIGDDGLKALSSVLAGGALAQL